MTVPPWVGLAELLLAGVLALLAGGAAWALVSPRSSAGARIQRAWDRRGAGLAAAALVAGAVVTVLLDDLVLGDPDGFLPRLDQALRAEARALRAGSPGLQRAARLASWLTGPGLPLWLGATAVGLGVARRYRDAAVVVAGTLGAWALASGLKLLFAIRRPGAPVTDHAITGYGFPSAHALVAMVALGLVAWALTRGRDRARRGAAHAAAFAAAGVAAASRVILGVHWTSDVVAGLAMGVLWLALVVTLAERGAAAGEPAARGVL